ncbi:uncharacterized protein RJT21DRAFT_16465 [Scheffersomyces amazonensis]|uniref:uncharacterized protein n=1 Tax=Scheffersomyces amazonensis TaxID=1078765 RepID=UPI00315C7F28
MPFFIPLSFKIALAAGAFAGATITVMAHKEEILQIAEDLFERGAKFCRDKLEEAKQANAAAQYAYNFEDGEFDNYETEGEVNDSSGRSTGFSTPGSQSDYDEATTPSATDDESWDDLETQSLD